MFQESTEVEAEDFPDEFENTFTPYFTETETFICNVNLLKILSAQE